MIRWRLRDGNLGRKQMKNLGEECEITNELWGDIDLGKLRPVLGSFGHGGQEVSLLKPFGFGVRKDRSQTGWEEIGWFGIRRTTSSNIIQEPTPTQKNQVKPESKHKKKVKDSNEHKKYGSVSEDLLAATAKSQKLRDELAKLLNMEFPSKPRKNKKISEIEKSITEKVEAEKKHIFCSDSLNSSDSTVSVIEQSEYLETSKENGADICPKFATENSEAVLEQNCVNELDCSVTVTEGLQVEARNVMGNLIKDVDCLQTNENVEFEKKNPQEKQEECMSPNLQLQPSIDEVNNQDDKCDISFSKNAQEERKESITPNLQLLPSIDEVENQDDRDGISSLWRQMFLSLECSKDNWHNVLCEEGKHEPECDHSFINKDDLGNVCKLCGLVGQSAESIFEFHWKGRKRAKQSKHHPSEHMNTCSEGNFIEMEECTGRQQKAPVSKIVLHPLLEERMHWHQLDGFQFLTKNLITEEPGGCILAHAPGTGKTFLITSFIQSFLTKYPEERPLIVAPKTMLCSWMKEFKDWEVEEVPLYNLYEASNKTEPLRCNQLEILKEWRDKKSILLVSYAQFSSIVFEKPENDKTADHQSRQILLECPGLLILDEGHFPRNSNTNILNSLMQVRTRRRVLLSGTLFQNNITELFNLFKLVRPDILEEKSFKAIFKRIISNEKYPKMTNRRHYMGPDDKIFCGELENCLQNGSKEMKASAICDLQEVVSSFVHYYKGDILEELPGLTEFVVILRLNESQKEALESIKFSSGSRLSRDIKSSAVCIHPSLQKISIEKGDNSSGWLDSDSSSTSDITVDPNGGVKTKFILDMLSLCVLNEEKLLVFSQFLSPLALLENMIINKRNWIRGVQVLRLDGNTTMEAREIIIRQFNNSDDAKVLFASIRACGEGINLTGASRVVILDIPWNPSITRQAISRAFRIGQKKKVFAYRLVAANTLEEEIHRASFDKELLSKMIFDGSDQDGNSRSLMCEVGENECEDFFFDSKVLKENVKALYKLKLV